MTKAASTIEGNINEFEYVFHTVYPLTPDIIEAIALLSRNNLKNFRIYEITKKKEVEIPADELLTLSYENIIQISGYDRYGSMNIDLILYPMSHKMCIRVKNDTSLINSKFLNLKKESDKEKYIASVCGAFEILAHSYIKVGEGYAKLFKAARKYVDSNKDPQYAEYKEDGYNINLAMLFSPLQNG